MSSLADALRATSNTAETAGAQQTAGNANRKGSKKELELQAENVHEGVQQLRGMADGTAAQYLDTRAVAQMVAKTVQESEGAGAEHCP